MIRAASLNYERYTGKYSAPRYTDPDMERVRPVSHIPAGCSTGQIEMERMAQFPAKNSDSNNVSLIPERTWENVNRPLAIAIDGPVASGKTAVGRLVARRLGLRFLDTGSMYRAVTRVALDRCIDLNDGDALTALAERLDLRLSFAHGADRLTADGTDVTDGLRTPGVERGVSLVARVPGVRRSLVAQQRRMAADGPLVMAGRDIGTVVMPDAPVKVYLNASARVRATRRRGDLAAGGSEADERRVLEDLTRRDKIDSERSDSPLRPARDAVIMDTDDLRIEHVADKIVDLVECD